MSEETRRDIEKHPTAPKKIRAAYALLTLAVWNRRYNSHWTAFPIIHCTDHTAVTLTWELLHALFNTYSDLVPIVEYCLASIIVLAILPIWFSGSSKCFPRPPQMYLLRSSVCASPVPPCAPPTSAKDKKPSCSSVISISTVIILPYHHYLSSGSNCEVMNP